MSIPTFSQIAGASRAPRTFVWTRIVQGAVMTCAFFVPIMWWPIQDVFELPKLLGACLVLLLAILWLVAHHRERSLKLPLRLTTMMLISGLLFVGSVSMALSPDIGKAIFGRGGATPTSFGLLFLACIGCVVAAYVREETHAVSQRIRLASLGVFCLASVLTFAQVLGWLEFAPRGFAQRLFSPFGGMLAWAWVCAIVLLQGTVRANVRNASSWLEYGAVAIAGAGILLVDDGRVAIVLLILMGMVVVDRWFHRKILSWGHVAFSVGVTLASVVFALPKSGAMPFTAELSWPMSLRVLREALSAHPFFGIGAGQWSVWVERFRLPEMNLGGLHALTFETASSWYGTFLAEWGVFAGAMLLAVCIYAIVNVRHEDRWMVFFASVSLFALPLPGWMVLIAFACLGFATMESRDLSERRQQGMKIGIGVISLVVSVLFVGWMQRARAEYALVQGNAQQAARIFPWGADYRYGALQSRVADFSLQTFTPETETLRQKAMASMVEEARTITERWPHESSMWLARGWAYFALMNTVQGADQFAIQAFQEGMRRAPMHPGFPTGIARVYAWRAEALPKEVGEKNVEQVNAYQREQQRLSAQWWQRALTVKPDDEGIASALAIQAAKAGDFTTALPIVRALYERQPSQSNRRLDYASALAFIGERSEAITLALQVSTGDRLYNTSRKLIAEWCEAEKRYSEALSALKQLPAEERALPSIRKRIDALELRVRRL